MNVFCKVILLIMAIVVFFINLNLIEYYNKSYTGVDIMCIDLGLCIPMVIYFIISRNKF